LIILKSLPQIYSTALKSIVEASGAIMEIYAKDFQAIQKEDGSPVTEADFASSKIIAKYLRTTEIPIIGEELEIDEYELRKNWKENWLVDPLDGTRMFLARNNEFAINIAHIINGKPVFGMIGSPTEEKILIGGPAYGAYVVNYTDLEDPEKWISLDSIDHLNNPVVVICSRSYTHGSGFKYMQVLERQFGELDYMRKGSALKFFDLATGKADVYARFAPTMEWDIAAGQAIIETLGGTVVDVKNNRALRYNKENLYNPRLLAKTKAFAAAN
jgi:3'(2'), 5'-bisphosphate nucleotidase